MRIIPYYTILETRRPDKKAEEVSLLLAAIALFHVAPAAFILVGKIKHPYIGNTIYGIATSLWSVSGGLVTAFGSCMIKSRPRRFFVAALLITVGLFASACLVGVLFIAAMKVYVYYQPVTGDADEDEIVAAALVIAGTIATIAASRIYVMLHALCC